MFIVYSSVQATHQPTGYTIVKGTRYPSLDVPERAEFILDAIKKENLGPVVGPVDSGLQAIEAVHDSGMIEYVATAYARQNERTESPIPVIPADFPPPIQRRCPTALEGQKGFYCTDTTTPIDAHTWEASIVAAHCALTGARYLRSGERFVYALCRPPGHHAGPNFFGGYCYLNNAAIAAQSLHNDGTRVAILDIDYHHGNGTQAIFYSNPDMWYGSLHIDPETDYPFFAGYADETGIGPGEGTNWNVPLPPGTSQGDYLSALETLLMRLGAFNPSWLVVSAGFDSYIKDPVSTFQLTTDGFYEIGQHIHALGIPALAVQEGGYYLPDLGVNVVAFLKGLVD